MLQANVGSRVAQERLQDLRTPRALLDQFLDDVGAVDASQVMRHGLRQVQLLPELLPRAVNIPGFKWLTVVTREHQVTLLVEGRVTGSNLINFPHVRLQHRDELRTDRDIPDAALGLWRVQVVPARVVHELLRDAQVVTLNGLAVDHDFPAGQSLTSQAEQFTAA